jgi:hypothetical protein
VSNISRRNVIKGIAALPIVATLDSNVPGAPPEQSKPKPSRLADVGYVWEGQGFNRYLFPSIYGVGEGVRYFGLNKMVYMYHPNTRVAMEKLTSYSEVICDISKWKVRGQEDNSILKYHDGKIETKLEEARAVSDLSVQFPNVKGGYDDDLMGMIKKQGYTPDQYAPVYHELKKKNPNNKLWAVVYSHELEEKQWAQFAPYMDLISFWIWKKEDLPDLDRHINRCREVFPGKPISMGCYLRDWPSRTAMPAEMLKHQWERVVKYLQDGLISQFEIIEGMLIDWYPEPSRWVKDFIAAN